MVSFYGEARKVDAMPIIVSAIETGSFQAKFSINGSLRKPLVSR